MTSHSDHLPSVKPAILRTALHSNYSPSVKPTILRTVTPAPVATQTFPSKRVCQMTVYPPFPRNLLATHVFSSKMVCRGDRHRTSRLLQTQTPSKVSLKTIIPHLSTDTSAVSKPTNVQGDGEISVRKTFHQGRLCKFSLIPYSSTI